jgi:hypothetical protein
VELVSTWCAHRVAEADVGIVVQEDQWLGAAWFRGAEACPDTVIPVWTTRSLKSAPIAITQQLRDRCDVRNRCAMLAVQEEETI